jgi:hypothetical protein
LQKELAKWEVYTGIKTGFGFDFLRPGAGTFNWNPFLCTMSGKKQLLFDKGNYTIMLAGIALIVLGFVLMTMETAEYGFGPLGLTIGPGCILAGFLVEIYAILHKSKSISDSSES